MFCFFQLSLGTLAINFCHLFSLGVKGKRRLRPTYFVLLFFFRGFDSFILWSGSEECVLTVIDRGSY